MYKTIGFLLVAALFFSSCKTAMLYTTLDVLRPAKLEFAPDVENLLIVNNSKAQPAGVGHSSRLFNGQVQNVEISSDSVSLFCLSVLKEEIEMTDFFASVDLLLHSINNDQNFASISPLQRVTVEELCKTYDADAVLSLDHIVAKSELQEYYDVDWAQFLAVLETRYEMLWSIHYPNKVGAIAVQFKDSLFWEANSYNRNRMLESLPDRQDALIDGALLVGQNSAKRFVPYWEKTDRYFFDSNNKLMKQGMDSVYVRNWQSALDSWKQAFNSTSNVKLRAEAANNMAIANEILGEYDEALKYAKLSFDIFNSRILIDNDVLVRLSNYIVEVYQRKKEIDQLNKQLGK